MTLRGLPTLHTIVRIVDTEETALDFLIKEEILEVPEICVNCEARMQRYGKVVRCSNRQCRKSVSLSKGSFFAKSRVGINDTLLLGYLWIAGVNYSTAIALTTHSSGTIVEYYRYFRELVADSLDEVDWKIGGEGVIVEIDESKFGKRKYNRGHRIEGAWVIGGIERTAKRRFFVRVVENRNAETIADVLLDHVLPGSIVHTDCWRGYLNISEDVGVVHRTVNHSMHFVDPETGVHTNSIEGKWAGLKRRITLRGRVKDSLPDYLFEQIWRTRNKDKLWEGFLSSLKEVVYD